MRYAALILILLAGGVLAQDTAKEKSYLCVPDRATGFSFNEKTKIWDQTNFRVGDDKYMVRPITPDDKSRYGQPLKGAYGVWRLGEESIAITCAEGISEHDWLRCGAGYNTSFIMNTRTNRYMHIFQGSYMTSTMDSSVDKDGNLIYFDIEDEGGDTPYMEIGKCSPL